MNFETNYLTNPNFPNRYIAPEKLFDYLEKNFKNNIEKIGYSQLNRPIYQFRWGKGSLKLLAWSQMHGNESNSTHAFLDFLETVKHHPELSQAIENEISIDFIIMLNPDGSAVWTRRNALDIDLNRDFFKMSSKEFPILKTVAEKGNYDYAFNMHEQRTIFSTDSKHPATLSFLAPAENFERTITDTRKKAMAIISKITNQLKLYIPNQLARYSDEFYPNSTGDNFTKMGIPTVLFEGGHFPNDYLRKETRKYYGIAFYYGLLAIAQLKGSDENFDHYFELPENQESHCDVLYRNVKLNTDFSCVLDIAIQYQEQFINGSEEITFVPMVVEVGDCSNKKAWKEIDATGKFFKCKRKFPKLDAVQDFEII